MSVSSAKIKLNFGFADDTERPIEIGPFAPTAGAVTNAKTNIKAFDPADVAGLYLSDGGASCTGIVGATITKVSETEINLNVSE